MSLPGLAASVEDRARQWWADRTFRRRPTPADDPGADRPDHVVCIVVDALRADAVDPQDTPFLARLDPASAVTPSPWTFPAVTSLFTGTYPHRHGAMRTSDAYRDSVADMTPLPEPVPDDEVLLSDRFAGAGYDTFGGFGMIVPFLALEGRFATHRLIQDADAETLLGAHEDWLADAEGPTFSYLHLADLHEPVDPPRAYWDSHDVDRSIPGIRGWRFEDVVDATPTVERFRRHRRRLYEAAVEYVDHRLGAYHARLEHLLDGDVLLVVTGDHGEAFWQAPAFAARTFADPRPAYGVGHGGVPFEAVTRVPLAIHDPASGLASPEARASLVDLAPTLLERTGLSSGDVDGYPVGDAPPDRRLLVEGTRYGHEKKAVYGEDAKLVVSPGDRAAFATRLDGGAVPEREPITVADPEVHRELARAFPAWPDGELASAPGKAVQRRLEQLGYM